MSGDNVGSVGTGAGGVADPASTEATAWDNRSAGCPEDPAQAHALHPLEVQIRDLLEEREELLTEIRRLRMGNHPAGRALRIKPALDDEHSCFHSGDPWCVPCRREPPDNVIALREACEERDAGHEGGEGT